MLGSQFRKVNGGSVLQTTPISSVNSSCVMSRRAYEFTKQGLSGLTICATWTVSIVRHAANPNALSVCSYPVRQFGHLPYVDQLTMQRAVFNPASVIRESIRLLQLAYRFGACFSSFMHGVMRVNKIWCTVAITCSRLGSLNAKIMNLISSIAFKFPSLRPSVYTMSILRPVDVHFSAPTPSWKYRSSY